jgi:hypothetical protein
MSAAVTDLGGGSIGGHMPLAAGAVVAAEAAIALPMADINAQIAGAAEAALHVAIQPPSIDLTAALAASASTPGVAVDVSAMATLGVELAAKRGALEAALAAVGEVKVVFDASGGVGVRLYRIDGEVGSMAGALGGVINSGLPGGSGPNQVGVAFVLIAADDGTIAALEALFGG